MFPHSITILLPIILSSVHAFQEVDDGDETYIQYDGNWNTNAVGSLNPDSLRGGSV